MVCQGNAFADRAAEESGANATVTPGAVAELVPRPRDGFSGHRGRFELQRETDHEKGVWISDVASSENRVVSSTRSAPGAGIDPRILLTRLNPGALSPYSIGTRTGWARRL